MITVEKVGHVLLLTLDRPEQLNALNVDGATQLRAVLDRADADDMIRTVFVTGRGRAFCAGADLSRGAETFSVAVMHGAGATAEGWRDLWGVSALRLHALLKPVIGAVNGHAVGVRASMLLPMDVRLASTEALHVPVRSRGSSRSPARSWFLPRVVGITTAQEWVLTARGVGTEEARERGLVGSVYPSYELVPAALALAAKIAEQAAPVATTASRHPLWHALEQAGLEESHLLVSAALKSLWAAVAREGFSAFLEKWPPVFTGRVSRDLPGSFPWPGRREDR
jgi:enoyl-CoA hydratase/carnithine racemase